MNAVVKLNDCSIYTTPARFAQMVERLGKGNSVVELNRVRIVDIIARAQKKRKEKK